MVSNSALETNIRCPKLVNDAEPEDNFLQIPPLTHIAGWPRSEGYFTTYLVITSTQDSEMIPNTGFGNGTLLELDPEGVPCATSVPMLLQRLFASLTLNRDFTKSCSREFTD